MKTLVQKLEKSETYRSLIGKPNPMAIHKVVKARKKRKKQRGIKHGRR